MSGTSVCEDRFYFIFEFSFYKVRRWFQEVCSVDVIFFIEREEGGMEDGVDSPLWWEQ